MSQWLSRPCRKRRASAREDGGVSGVSSSCGACGLGDLPNPGIEPRSPAFQADSLLSEPPGKPKNTAMGEQEQRSGSPFPSPVVTLVAPISVNMFCG